VRNIRDEAIVNEPDSATATKQRRCRIETVLSINPPAAREG
jgi:hypothetical protein